MSWETLEGIIPTKSFSFKSLTLTRVSRFWSESAKFVTFFTFNNSFPDFFSLVPYRVTTLWWRLRYSTCWMRSVVNGLMLSVYNFRFYLFLKNWRTLEFPILWSDCTDTNKRFYNLNYKVNSRLRSFWNVNYFLNLVLCEFDKF